MLSPKWPFWRMETSSSGLPLSEARALSWGFSRAEARPSLDRSFLAEATKATFEFFFFLLKTLFLRVCWKWKQIASNYACDWLTRIICRFQSRCHEQTLSLVWQPRQLGDWRPVWQNDEVWILQICVQWLSKENLILVSSKGCYWYSQWKVVVHGWFVSLNFSSVQLRLRKWRIGCTHVLCPIATMTVSVWKMIAIFLRMGNNDFSYKATIAFGICFSKFCRGQCHPNGQPLVLLMSFSFTTHRPVSRARRAFFH